MITQPNAYIEARPTERPVQHDPRAHLPRRSTQTPNLALAGLQLIVGYAWLLAGVDKLLLGVFPAQLGGLLHTAVSSGHLPGFFIAILRGLVVPNAVLFGYLIEWGETLAGLLLVIAGLVALLRPLAERSLDETPAALFLFGARLLERLAPLAATGGGLLGLSHFLRDCGSAPWFVPGHAVGGGIGIRVFLAVPSVVLVASQIVPLL